MRFRFPSVFLLSLGLFSLHSYAAGSLLPASAVPVATAAADQATHIDADQLEGKKDEGMEAHGNVELQQGSQKVYAEHLYYEQTSRDVFANGSVRVEQPGVAVSGPDLKMNLDTNIGEMSSPVFQFQENKARGSATMMRRTGILNYEFDNAIYTTCPAGNDDWLLKMSHLEIDKEAQIGTAHNAWVEFKGVPLLYAPWMDFPLNSDRHSGFLAPSMAVTSFGGTEVTLPYYLNIAPNYDATIAPRVMAMRGVLLNDEFRFMGESYAGEAHYDAIENDRLTNTSRYHASLKESQNLGGGFGATVNLNRVSDDAYFRDFSTTTIGGTQTQLLNEGVLSYGGGWWSSSVRAQTFQTLQDPLAAPVAIPYQRLPQITLSANKTLGDVQVSAVNEYVNFQHPALVNGQRLVLYPSVTYTLLNDPGFYLKPKLGIHNTEYVMGANNTSNTPDATRTLPIFSLDSGMTFERDMSLGKGQYVQTLEPRMYYVRIPYQDQSFLPVYDTAQSVFNFTQMFSENRFLGNDRVGDANMMTVGLTSRLIDNEHGTERLRLALGERFSFEAPMVNLLPPNLNSRSSILLSAGGRATNALTLDSLLEYDPNTANMLSYNASSKYKPETGKVLNLGYRYTLGDIPQNDVRQADFSTQWPLFGHWYTVSRFSYSYISQQVLQKLVGLEYNQSCWVLRMVMQQFPINTQQVSTGIFIQLELNDLVAVGNDPLNALRTSVPGYSKLNIH